MVQTRSHSTPTGVRPVPGGHPPGTPLLNTDGVDVITPIQFGMVTSPQTELAGQVMTALRTPPDGTPDGTQGGNPNLRRVLFQGE